MHAGEGMPAFRLEDGAGVPHHFPSGRITIVGFVKDDCPTCHEVAPVLEAMYRSFGAAVDWFIAGQTREGNHAFAAKHALSLPLLDDSALKVSFACDVDTVPCLYLATPEGTLERALVGFVRDEWRALCAELADRSGVDAARRSRGPGPT